MKPIVTFIALDAEDEPTLWESNGRDPIALLRRCDLPEQARDLVWPVIVGRFG